MAEPPKTRRPVQAPKPVPKKRRTPPPPGKRQGIPRRWLYAGAAGLAAVIAAVLIVVSVTGGSNDANAPVDIAAEDVEELFAGIPQDGAVLGSPDAPVTLIEYADPQCPFCAQFARDVLPTIVDEYVRPGKVRLVFRGVAILGPDSSTALRYIYSAGEQDKLWNVAELVFRYQGGENEGWVTSELMNSIGEAVPGLDVNRWRSQLRAEPVVTQIEDAFRSAQEISLPGTPTFLIGADEESAEMLEIESLTVEEFREKLDAALEG